MDFTRFPVQPRQPSGVRPGRWLADLLARQSRGDLVAPTTAVGRPQADESVASAVLTLVEAGVLDRVAARAVLLVADGRLDERDLKQLLRRSRPTARWTASADVPAATPRVLAVGQAFGRYLVSGRLGRGATSRVYLAAHPTLRVPVALKVPHRVPGGSAGRLRDEAAVLARVSHPNVVRVWDVEQADGDPFLVLEHLDGGSLARALRRAGRVPPPRAYRAVLSAARGLRAAHRMDICHGDVKPGNILGTRAGTYKLADFGSARRQAAGPDGGVVEGSWAYRAPEGFTGQADPRADIYSLGLTLHHLLTGVPAVAGDFDACLEQHRALALEPAHWSVPGVDPAVSALIRRMTARHPADRFPDCDALILAARRAFTQRGTDR